MLIIEFLGAPCSGKSQISHELAALIREYGKSVCEKQYELSHTQNRHKRVLSKILKTAKMCVLHPLTSYRLLKKLGNRRCWINYLDILATTANDDVLIFEQGLCQCIGSLFDNKKIDEATAKKLFDELLPKQADRILVFVQIDRSVLTKRMDLREDKPFYLNSDDVSAAIDGSINTAECLRDRWRSKYGDQYLISVSNNQDNQSIKAARSTFDALKEKGSI